MGPRLIGALASCAGLICAVPATAEKLAPGKEGGHFRSTAAAIIGRDRATSRFRLADRQPGYAARHAADPLPMADIANSPAAAPSIAANRGAMLKVSAMSDDRRNLSIGLDTGRSGPALSQASPARRSGQQMANAGSCAGLMPAFACGANSGYKSNDSVLALGLAYNF